MFECDHIETCNFGELIHNHKTPKVLQSIVKKDNGGRETPFMRIGAEHINCYCTMENQGSNIPAQRDTSSRDLSPQAQAELEKLEQALLPGRFSGLSGSERDAVLSNGEKLILEQGKPGGLFLVDRGGLVSVSTILVKMSRKIPVSTLTNLGKVLVCLLRSIEGSNSLAGVPSNLAETLVKLIQESHRKVKKQRQARARAEWAIVLQFWLKAASCTVDIVQVRKGCFHEITFVVDTLFSLLLEEEFQQLAKEACPLVCFVLDDEELMIRFLTAKDGKYFNAWLGQIEGADAPEDWMFYAVLCSGLSKLSFTDITFVSDLAFRLGALILQELSNVNLLLFERDKQLQSDVEVGEKCFLALLCCFCAFCRNSTCIESVTSVPITVETVFSIHPELLQDASDFEVSLYKFPSGLDQVWSYLYGLKGCEVQQCTVIPVFHAMINIMNSGSYRPPVESIRVVEVWLSQASRSVDQLACVQCLTKIVDLCRSLISFSTDTISETIRTIFNKIGHVKDSEDSELVQSGLECALLLAETNEEVRLIERAFLPDLADLLLMSLENNVLISCQAVSRVILSFCTPERLHSVKQLIALGLFTLFDVAFHNLGNRHELSEEVVRWHRDVLDIILLLSRTHTRKEVEEGLKGEILRSLTNHRPVLRLVMLRVGTAYQIAAVAFQETDLADLCWHNTLKSFLAAEALPNIQIGEEEQHAVSLVAIIKVLHAPLQIAEAEYQSLTNLILRTLETVGSALKSIGALETVRVVANGCASAINSKSPLTATGKMIISKLAEIVMLCCHIDDLALSIEVASMVVKSLTKVLDDTIPATAVASSSGELKVDNSRGWPETMVFHVLVCMHVLINKYFSMEIVHQVNGSVLRTLILGFTASGTFVDHQENEWELACIATLGMVNIIRFCAIFSQRYNVYSQFNRAYNSFKQQDTLSTAWTKARTEQNRR